jgi:hypothetical protein
VVVFSGIFACLKAEKPANGGLFFVAPSPVLIAYTMPVMWRIGWPNLIFAVA